MRAIVFVLVFIVSAAACAADMEPVGTAAAERAAALAAEKAAAEAEAARTAKAAAEKAAAEEAARAAAEAQKAAAAEAERAAKEAADREAKDAAAKAEREAKEAAEREAAAKAERAAKEAAEREAAAKAATAQSSTTNLTKTEEPAAPGIQCETPALMANADAAKAIADRAMADARANAAAPAQLILAAKNSVAVLASSYALDEGIVSRAYLAALCKQLVAAGGSPQPLRSLLVMLADALGEPYAVFTSTDEAKGPQAGEGGQSSPGSQGAPVTVQITTPKPPEGGPGQEAQTPAPQPAEQKPAEAGPAPAGTPAAAGAEEEARAAAEAQKAAAAEAERASKEAAEREAAAKAEREAKEAADREAAAKAEREAAAKTAEAKPAPPDMAGGGGAVLTERSAEPPKASAESRAAKTGAPGTLSEGECRALGVLGKCPDLKAVFDQLLEKPLEYNHPSTMLLGHKTEIALVLRTDWEGKGLPPTVSDELKGLPGDVKQGLSKITRIMSAELSGSDFEISPAGQQDRTVVPPEPVSWNWQVTPNETGNDKTLKLRLYAHLEGPGGAMPPILVKTLDATINVDVTTWDWMVNQARTLEPLYTVTAALLGLLTAMLTFIFARRRRAARDGGGSLAQAADQLDLPGPLERWIARRRGPVIGDLNQSAADSRTPAAPPPPPKPGPERSGGAEPGGTGPDDGSKPDKD